MRTTLALIASLLLITSMNEPIERLGIKGPLVFGDTSFQLAWTDKPNEKYYVQEYLPKNESLEKFNQMLSVYLFITDTSPKMAVQQKIKWLDEKKKTDPVCNYNLIESPDGKEFILDFILSQSQSNKMTTVEFNVYRYAKLNLNGKGAISVYSYSKRSYGDSIAPFLTDLSKDKNKYLNQMIAAKGNAIVINNN